MQFCMEGRLWVVFNRKLDRLGRLLAAFDSHQRQGHINSRRNSCRGDDLSFAHHTFADRLGAILPQGIESKPVAGGPDPTEYPGCGENSRAGAHGGRPIR